LSPAAFRLSFLPAVDVVDLVSLFLLLVAVVVMEHDAVMLFFRFCCVWRFDFSLAKLAQPTNVKYRVAISADLFPTRFPLFDEKRYFIKNLRNSLSCCFPLHADKLHVKITKAPVASS
jgi:hypothetical protein